MREHSFKARNTGLALSSPLGSQPYSRRDGLSRLSPAAPVFSSLETATSQRLTIQPRRRRRCSSATLGLVEVRVAGSLSVGSIGRLVDPDARRRIGPSQPTEQVLHLGLAGDVAFRAREFEHVLAACNR